MKGISHLKEEQFRRRTGVKPETFEKMLGILERGSSGDGSRGGRPRALPVAEMLLMTLEYLREYRTYFHIATSYGVCESTAYRSIRWVEETLVRDGAFALPGRKELLKSETPIEVILVDATECPVQRPKKNSGATTRARSGGTRTRSRSS